VTHRYALKNEGVLDEDVRLRHYLTRESCRNLDLKLGSRVYATFKATAVHVIPMTQEENILGNTDRTG
jgi:hypothetical protein